MGDRAIITIGSILLIVLLIHLFEINIIISSKKFKMKKKLQHTIVTLSVICLGFVACDTATTQNGGTTVDSVVYRPT